MSMRYTSMRKLQQGICLHAQLHISLNFCVKFNKVSIVAIMKGKDLENLENYFGAGDFAVFLALLILSALIGIYFGYKDKKKKSIETYYYGDRNISPLAVAMSMAVSFVSAITVIGYPVETYFHGVIVYWIAVAVMVGATFATVYFIPFIFRLQLNSIYEYLELRYNKLIRQLCSGLYIMKMVIYMGNTVYLPALALNSVTPLDLSWSIALTSLICTFYTTLGGIKAVIWTDVLQGCIMVFGALALFIKATIDIGGVGIVWESALKGQRLNMFNFESDIRVSSSAAAYFFSFCLLTTDSSCFTQVYSQRYMSCKSVTAARWAGMLRIIPVSLFILLAVADGLAMHAYYEGCDPYGAGYLTKKDQMSPRFAVEVFRTLPGLAGLFVAAAYSGTLSTVSSGINALAAITARDFVYPCWPKLPESRESFIAKILTVVYGCLVTCFAYIVSRLDATIVQISFALSGVFSGPVFAVFLMGTMCPWSNEKGALAGIFTGGVVVAWCFLGRIFSGVNPEFTHTLPLSVEECYVNVTSSTVEYGLFNTTSFSSTTNAPSLHRSPLDDTLYAVSPYFYGTIGFVSGIIAILLVSGLTGFNKPKEMRPDLFVPLIENEKIFTKRIVKFFRFGVPELTKHDEIIPLREGPNIDAV